MKRRAYFTQAERGNCFTNTLSSMRRPGARPIASAILSQGDKGDRDRNGNQAVRAADGMEALAAQLQHAKEACQARNATIKRYCSGI